MGITICYTGVPLLLVISHAGHPLTIGRNSTENQNLENRTPKTYKKFFEFQEAITELEAQTQRYAIAGKIPKGIPVNVTRYQTYKCQGSAEIAMENHNYRDASSKSLLRIQT